MEIAALMLATIKLVLAIMDDWRAGKPQRDKARTEQHYDADLERVTRSLARGDAEGISQAFERERLEGLRLVPPGVRRVVPGPAPAGAHEFVPRTHAGDPGQPAS